MLRRYVPPPHLGEILQYTLFQWWQEASADKLHVKVANSYPLVDLPDQAGPSKS